MKTIKDKQILVGADFARKSSLRPAATPTIISALSASPSWPAQKPSLS